MSDAPTPALPPALSGLVDDFGAVGERERLQLLLEISHGLPALPERFAAAPELLEPVPECQAPVAVLAEVDPDPASTVHLYFTAPREAPTTRGFAGILREGLDGLPAAQVLAVPDDLHTRFGLERAVSPLRLRGMEGLLRRLKRQVREKSGMAA